MRGIVLVGLVLLASCGPAPQNRAAEELTTYDVEPAAAPPAPSSANADGPAPIAVAIPQMAYSYGYTFRLPGDAIVAAQQAHVALCDRLGPARCQVLGMRNGQREDDATDGTLKLRVQSSIARAFGQQLQASVAKIGGRSVSSTIAAEDVSKDIVDTEARLRQRTLLVERLTEILRTRSGKVSELVEAERSVAAAQEEIDQAKGWLAELRGRVAMATVDIGYRAVAAEPGSPRGSLSEAVAGSWSAFAIGVGGIVRLLIFLAPWALVVGLSAVGVRVLLRRRKRGDDSA